MCVLYWDSATLAISIRLLCSNCRKKVAQEHGYRHGLQFDIQIEFNHKHTDWFLSKIWRKIKKGLEQFKVPISYKYCWDELNWSNCTTTIYRTRSLETFKLVKSNSHHHRTCADLTLNSLTGAEFVDRFDPQVVACTAVEASEQSCACLVFGVLQRIWRTGKIKTRNDSSLKQRFSSRAVQCAQWLEYSNLNRV